MSKAANTRHYILQHAFDLIYKQGYQATSIDMILATTQVTKGAFFYHFKNKEDMGLAMINEVMYPDMHQELIQPLHNATDPLTDIYLMMKNLLLNSPFFNVRYGCPAVNLIEELAPISDNFSIALLRLMEEWQDSIRTAIVNGKEAGKVKSGTQPKQVAYFIVAGYSGIRNMGKIQGMGGYTIYLKELKNYLDNLR